MKKGDNVRIRTDGRYEARYIKGRDSSGKIIYGYCYGSTEEEAREKREYQLQKMARPREMNLLILGAGSHGTDVYEIAKGLRIFSKINFLDDATAGAGILGKWSELEHFAEEYPIATVAVGDEETRRTWMERLTGLGFMIPTLVHPSAFIPDDTQIGTGTVICARATVSTGVSIGKGCIITSGSTIPRKTRIPNWGYFDFDKIIHYSEVYNLDRSQEEPDSQAPGSAEPDRQKEGK